MRQRFLALGLGLVVAGAGLPAIAADAANGKTLYDAFCAQCHGLQGTGDGVNALTMEIKPRDHTDSREMAARTDDDLFTAVKEGGAAINKSIMMPRWDANLTDDEIRDLVAYMRILSNTESR